MSPAPIRVHCEGSGATGHRRGLAACYVMCPMCGLYPGTDESGVLIEHDRKDIIAMLDRGDFG